MKQDLSFPHCIYFLIIAHAHAKICERRLRSLLLELSYKIPPLQLPSGLKFATWEQPMKAASKARGIEQLTRDAQGANTLIHGPLLHSLLSKVAA